MEPLAGILEQILGIRREVSGEFRQYLVGGAADQARVLDLSRRYGALDGALSVLMATRFAEVFRTLSTEQKAALKTLRNQDVFPEGYYLYADPVKEALNLDAAFLFAE
jgi:hypothetical protein